MGDKVRILLRKDNKTKGYHPKFSNDMFKVLHIRDKDYLINDGK